MVQKLHAQSDTKASRAKFNTKPLLAKLISLVGTVPPETYLPSIPEMVNLMYLENTQNNDCVTYQEALRRCLEGRPELERYVREVGSDSWVEDAVGRLKDAIERYEDFRESRLKLCSLARFNTAKRQRGEDDDVRKLKSIGNISDISQFENLRKDLGVVASFNEDEQGFIRFSKSTFAEAVEGVLANRIRECEVCQRVFWAQRSDAMCCSPEHAHVRRSRLARRNWREKKDDYVFARYESQKKSAKKGK